MEKILGSPKKQWKSPFSQQGDVPLKKIGIFGVFEKEFENIPKDAKKTKDHLVLKGQTNSHALYGGKFEVLKSESNPECVFIKVKEPTVLDHVKDHNDGKQERAEHHGQWVPVGEYFYDGLLEFDHALEESRVVID